MHNCKILYAFLCICVSIQVFCGDEHEHDHDHDHDHDHHEDYPNAQPPVIFHNPGVFPVVPTQNPYVYVANNVNYPITKLTQRDPNNPNFQPVVDHNQYGSNNQYGNNDRDRNYDGQKDSRGNAQHYNGNNGQATYQLSEAFPEGCDLPGRESNKYCKMTVKIIPNKNKSNYYTFELTGKSNGYIAVGLSEDLFMGDDHIVECIRKSDGRFEHYQSFSKRQLMPERIRDDPSIVNNFHYGYKDGYISCSFDRYVDTFINHNGKKFTYNLSVGNHHILLAMGDLKDSVKDEIGYHGKDQRYVSPKYINEMKKSPYYYYRNGSPNMNPISSIFLILSAIYTMYA